MGRHRLLSLAPGARAGRDDIFEWTNESARHPGSLSP